MIERTIRRKVTVTLHKVEPGELVDSRNSLDAISKRAEKRRKIRMEVVEEDD